MKLISHSVTPTRYRAKAPPSRPPERAAQNQGTKYRVKRRRVGKNEIYMITTPYLIFGGGPLRERNSGPPEDGPGIGL